MLHPAARPLGLAMACSLLCLSLAAEAEESPHTGGEQQRPLIFVESVKPQGGRAAVDDDDITDDDLAAIAAQQVPACWVVSFCVSHGIPTVGNDTVSIRLPSWAFLARSDCKNTCGSPAGHQQSRGDPLPLP